MKTLQILFSACLILVAFGCHRRSDDAVPAGSSRLVVDDMVKDETFRIASLKVFSLQPGTLSVGMEGGRANGELLISPTDKLREGRVLFIASRATDSHSTNVCFLTQFQIAVGGGDGGMLTHGAFQSRCGATYYRPADTTLAGFLNMTAQDGIYPLGAPVEIGRIDGKPVTLTIQKQTL